jgi:UDP-glucose 6-dehydrogenase
MFGHQNVKLTANTFWHKVSSVNAMSELCEKTGASHVNAEKPLVDSRVDWG